MRLPFRLLVRGSDVAARLGLLGFGADRAIFLNGPLALDPGRARAAFGWKAARGSAQYAASPSSVNRTLRLSASRRTSSSRSSFR